MKIQEIENKIFTISECSRPIWNESLCNDLADAGIQSLLVVDDDTTPWPSGQGRLWCYVRPFADSTCPMSSELQRITDFVHYETSHGRTVGIWIGYKKLQSLIVRTALAKPPAPHERSPSDDPCCCRPWHQGCNGSLVCHASPVELAKKIFESGRLLSIPIATGKSLKDVTREMRKWPQPDPPDYFQYICLANGNCIAPDMVAIQRHAGKWLDATQCEKFFYPGVRFFFDPCRLAAHPKAAWDGIQAVKIQDEIDLNSYLLAAVVPAVDRNGAPLNLQVPPNLAGRVIVLDHHAHFGLSAWSDAAFDAAKKKKKNTRIPDF